MSVFAAQQLVIFPIRLLALLRAIADLLASGAVHELCPRCLFRFFATVETPLGPFPGSFGTFGDRPIHFRAKFLVVLLEILA